MVFLVVLIEKSESERERERYVYVIEIYVLNYV